MRGLLPLVAAGIVSLVTLPVRAESLVGLTSTGSLVAFDSEAPEEILVEVDVTGLIAGDSLVGIDFRPATKTLYGVGAAARLYTIDVTTGVATPVAGASFTPALSGSAFGIDFNPTVDRLRIVSNTGQNLRLDPAVATAAIVDTPLGPGSPNIVANAYSNNFAGATVTTLYAIDAASDALYIQNPPNSGTLNTVGILGIDITDTAGFDISPSTGAAWAALSPTGSGSSRLYRIDLFTGQAAEKGPIGDALSITDLSTSFELPVRGPLFAVTSTDLIAFSPATPTVIDSTHRLTGLAVGETPVALDLRPVTGELVLLTSAGTLYRVDRKTGATTLIGREPVALQGTSFGVDFNPGADRLRIVSEAAMNLRVNPDTGAIAATDAALSYDALDIHAGTSPTVGALAYDSSPPFTVATAFAIDTSLDLLVRLGGLDGTPSANTGLLFSVGPLGIDAPSSLSFDISETGVAFAAMVPPAEISPALFLIHLPTGAARALGAVATGAPILGLALESEAIPSGLALDPTNGPAAGGTDVTLTGERFLAGARVTVGSADATVTSVSPTTITFVTPPGTGSADVVVHNINGLEATAPTAFVYEDEGVGGSGAGGSAADGGASAGGGPQGGSGSGDDGCGCRLVGEDRTNTAAPLAILAGMAALLRRRRITNRPRLPRSTRRG
jgi:hypothetical protein